MRQKELAKSLELDELVIVAWTYDPAPRHRSYELLAQAFKLEKTKARPPYFTSPGKSFEA